MKKFRIEVSSKIRKGESSPRIKKTWVTNIHGVINASKYYNKAGWVKTVIPQ
jgi:hypothetical protein